MNVHYLYSLVAVVVLGLIAYVGAGAAGLQAVFGIFIPYLALVVFLAGFINKVLCWAKSPVPFRIPSTCGQQQSMDWIKQNKFDNPSTLFGVIGRMFLEIVAFRSLFRNTRMKSKEDGRITYQLEIFLWVGALAFHYAFAAVVVRHLRFFMEPVPAPIKWIEAVDAFFQFGLPVVYLSGVVLLAAVVYLALRRIFIPMVRYISLANDFFGKVVVDLPILPLRCAQKLARKKWRRTF